MLKVSEKIVSVWAIAGGVLLLTIMAVTSLNVTAFGLDRIARLFGSTVSGLPGYEDYVSLAISCAALMFLPYCQLRRGHVAVDLFVNLLKPAVRRVLDRLWLAAICALALFLAYWMALGMLETRADNVLSPVLGWRQWPFYVPGVISLLLWAMVAAAQVFAAGDADA